MVIIQARLGGHRSGHSGGRASMSIVLDNGDIHHFFALPDGVHHSKTHQYRGSYRAAVKRELARPGAVVLSDESGLIHFERPEAFQPESLAS
ncbi:MAG: hypothetical protein ACYDCQ_18130 [Dehalococcoidia bacterium]